MRTSSSMFSTSTRLRHCNCNSLFLRFTSLHFSSNVRRYHLSGGSFSQWHDQLPPVVSRNTANLHHNSRTGVLYSTYLISFCIASAPSSENSVGPLLRILPSGVIWFCVVSPYLSRNQSERNWSVSFAD